MIDNRVNATKIRLQRRSVFSLVFFNFKSNLSCKKKIIIVCYKNSDFIQKQVCETMRKKLGKY